VKETSPPAPLLGKERGARKYRNNFELIILNEVKDLNLYSCIILVWTCYYEVIALGVGGA